MLELIKGAFYKLPKNTAACFLGHNILWHLFAVGLTYFLVVSGFDWLYFESTRNVFIESVGLVPAVIGFLVPFIVPIAMHISGKRNNDPQTIAADNFILVFSSTSSFGAGPLHTQQSPLRWHLH